MVVTPVTASPWIMAQLMGAAPLCRGKREACTFTVPNLGTAKSFLERIWPKAAVTATSGASARKQSSPSCARRRSNWYTGRPNSSAFAFTGGGASLCPRPTGRSGCVITPAMV